jgi:hypothetical protein
MMSPLDVGALHFSAGGHKRKHSLEPSRSPHTLLLRCTGDRHGGIVRDDETHGKAIGRATSSRRGQSLDECSEARLANLHAFITLAGD